MSLPGDPRSRQNVRQATFVGQRHATSTGRLAAGIYQGDFGESPVELHLVFIPRGPAAPCRFEQASDPVRAASAHQICRD
jgi:hypothetical protein